MASLAAHLHGEQREPIGLSPRSAESRSRTPVQAGSCSSLRGGGRAMKWQGVIPAITTPFKPDLSVDADLLVKQVDALVRAGCTGIVALGSLGEGGSLSFDEKKAVLRLSKE